MRLKSKKRKENKFLLTRYLSIKMNQLRPWHLIVLITCGITAVIYPFSIVNEYKSFKETEFLILMSGEVIMLFDIIVNMLLAYKNEHYEHYVIDIQKIS